MPRKAATKATTTEATKPPSKRQHVLEYMVANPKATPTEVSVGLKEKGVEISPMYVSNIKSTSKAKGKRGRKKAKAPAAASKAKAPTDLAAAAQLVAKLGGLQQAKKTIEQLEEIKKLV
ncbi:MAG: hypothetical protein ABSG68_03680 [Thermoguttaceae bacterium]|jgi:hypothetical protein